MNFRSTIIAITAFTALTVNAQDQPVKDPAIYFDIAVGSATRLGEKDPNPSTQRYSELLRTGISFDVSMYFRVKAETNHFVGFKYNTFRKEAGYSGNNVPGAPKFEASDKVNLDFIGIGYLYAFAEADRKSEWNVEGAFGYMTYKDQGTFNRDSFDVTANTVGVFLGASYFIKLYKGLFIGPKLSLLIGNVKGLEINGSTSGIRIDPNYRESLNRFDAAGSIRLKF